MGQPNIASPDRHTGGCFTTTDWSLVCAAAETGSPRQSAALEELCRLYWPPLYAYLRRSGHRPQDAEDLTQAFLARLLERGLLAYACPERGRFRNFLLAALKNFAADARDHATALKRGGNRPPLSLDVAEAERDYRALASPELAPDAVYERTWALAVLDRALTALRAEYAARGREALFDGLKDHVWGEARETIARAGAALGLTETAARVAVHRLRQRFGALLRQQVAETLADPAEVDAELRHLLSIFAG